MGVNAEITRKLDNGLVQVDISTNKSQKRYYAVPQQKADSFIDNYKKQAKNAGYITNTTFPISILGGVMLTNLLIRNVVKDTTAKFLLATTGGVAAAIAIMYETGKYLDNKKKELITQHQAKEIFYEA